MYNITLKENQSTVPQKYYDVDSDFVSYIWNKHSVDEMPQEIFNGEPIDCGNDHTIIVEVAE
jgi:hypothetical protein